MSNKIRLTNAAVERAAVGIHWFERQRGDGALGLRVADSGRSYFLKRRVNGKERSIVLGRHGEPVLLPDGKARSFGFGAEDARAKATAVVGQMLQGIDPVAEKERKQVEATAKAEQNKALSTTLQQVMDDYLEHHRVKDRPLRPKTKFDYRTFMERHFADWMPNPVAGINRTMCDDKIREIEKSSRTQSHKGRVYLRMYLSHAREMHGTDEGYPILSVNPVTRMLTKTHPPKARKRRIPAAAIGKVWLMLRRRAANPIKEVDRTGADWVSTLLLTGWRSSECAALEWSWIDLAAKTVTLPADMDPVNERAFAGVKTHAEITLPISDALHSILMARFELESKDERYVFSGRADAKMPYISSAHGTMRAVAEVAGMDRISPHDFRRSFLSAAKACRVDYGDRMHLVNHSSKTVHEDYEREDDPEVLRDTVNLISNHILAAARVAESQENGGNIIAFPAKAGGFG